MLDDFYNGFLITPLNWGLGHATRCMPIIRYLIEKEIRVVIASDGEALQLLQHEFPQLDFEELPSYNVKYTADNRFARNMLKQVPKIFQTISREHEAMDEIVRKYRISKIISDNRYGCYHKDTQNYFITHQLNPKLNGWYKNLGWLLELILRSKFDNFDQVWIPDDESINLSGELSELAIADKKYIGIVSRFDNEDESPAVIENELLVILSGIEPQRSIIEEKIIAQLNELPITSIIVRGVVDDKDKVSKNDKMTIMGRMDAVSLAALIKKSRYVICRSGYSSLMDLAVLGKKAILIPTPGQTEQEYLAEKLMKEKRFLMQDQEQIDIKKALAEIDAYSGIKIDASKINQFKTLIDKMIV